MKKHELIKHAYDNYQKGTICTWYNNKKDFHYTEFQSSGEFEFDDTGDIFINYPDDQTVEYVYCDGEWAKIVAQYPPKKEFVMMSEDWVSLEEGDVYFGVYKDHGKYILDQSDDEATKGKSINHYLKVKHLLGDYKVFSTKEAAEKWIEEQNKPKQVCISLFNPGSSAEVSKDVIMLNIDGYRLGIKPSDIEDMLHAYKNIQS